MSFSCKRSLNLDYWMVHAPNAKACILISPKHPNPVGVSHIRSEFTWRSNNISLKNISTELYALRVRVRLQATHILEKRASLSREITPLVAMCHKIYKRRNVSAKISLAAIKVNHQQCTILLPSPSSLQPLCCPVSLACFVWRRPKHTKTLLHRHLGRFRQI